MYRTLQEEHNTIYISSKTLQFEKSSKIDISKYFQEMFVPMVGTGLFTSVTFTLRRPYGGRRTRVIPAVAVEILYGESLCFTGRRGGRRIIARSYNFFHFYVRRRNLTRRI